MSKRIHTKVGLLFCASLLAACNGVTGVDELHVEMADGGVGGGGGLRPIIEPLITIPGISITEISLSQAVKVELMKDGMPATSTVPIVAGKDALLRVFVATDSSYTAVPVTARLFIEGNPKPFETTMTSLPAASKEEDLATTINFTVPGASITPSTNYKVLLGKPSGPIPLPSTTVVYPATGWDPIPAQSVGASLKLVLVPVQYGSDGSNRVLDTTTDVLQKYADGFRAMYPIPTIEVTVHDPFPWSQPISPDGTGWTELLSAVTDLRATDGAPQDVYYFAVFQPAASFSLYCGSGCVLGLANLADFPQDSGNRAAIGVAYFDGQGFGGISNADESVETIVHEIGHTHGRHHSPGACGAQGVDPSYPYPDGSDGTLWGYNIVTGKLYDPKINNDVMGYCQPNWIADYTYSALFDRVKAVNMARIEVPDELRNLTYDRILINQLGEMKWLPPLKMALPPHGEERKVVLESRLGEETATAQFVGFDHLAGGRLIWPSTQKPAQAIRFEYEGKMHRVLAPRAAP